MSLFYLVLVLLWVWLISAQGTACFQEVAYILTKPNKSIPSYTCIVACIVTFTHLIKNFYKPLKKQSRRAMAKCKAEKKENEYKLLGRKAKYFVPVK